LGWTATGRDHHFFAIVQFNFQYRFRKWAAILTLFVMGAFLIRSIQMTIANGFAAQSPLGFLGIQGALLLAGLSIWNGYRGTKYIAEATQ